MGKVHLPGTLIQDFTLVELAGDGTQSNVYLASRDRGYFWLLQLEDKEFDPHVEGTRIERFEIEGERWISLQARGTSIVDLASWVDRLEVPFIGWRWAIFARNVGMLHTDGKAMQHTDYLSLERLKFSEEGELIFAQPEPGEVDSYVFSPPEGLDKISPAGDVYSLGVSLQALLGQDVPFGVQPILNRATQPLPAKRYKNAREFGEELADVLPDPNRVKVPKPPRPASSYFRIACFSCLGLVVACVLFFACSTIYTMTDPNFRRQVEEMQRQIQEQQQRR